MGTGCSLQLEDSDQPGSPGKAPTTKTATDINNNHVKKNGNGRHQRGLSRGALDPLEVSGLWWEIGRFVGVISVVTDEDAVTVELLLALPGPWPVTAVCQQGFNLWHAVGNRVFWSPSEHITKPQYQLTTVSSLHSREVSVWNIGRLYVKNEEN